jgi:DNA-binding LytR/AlgR family response regulator
MTLNCVIIDDEPLAADLLTSYVKKTPFMHLVGTYNSAIEAIKDIKTNEVHLIFLDIQMPELSGVEFAKILSKDIKVIFTTAFSQYAIEGYKVDALDYLLKPISYEDFIAAANKGLSWFTKANMKHTYMQDRFIFVKSEYKLVRINLDDIVFIEGVKDYVKIYLGPDQKPIMSLMNMKKLEEGLPRPEFLRIHRSYIVHMPKVQMVDRFRLVFGDQFLPISDSYKDAAQQYFDSHSII